MANAAHIYKSKSGNWNMSFHHPICREGSIGKKIHRSLKVSESRRPKSCGSRWMSCYKLANFPPASHAQPCHRRAEISHRSSLTRFSIA